MSANPFEDTRSEAKRVLDEAARTIGAGGDRHRDYGSALDNFTDIGKMWAVLFGVDEITAEQVASAMAVVKLARLKHTPNHRDSFIDAIGYVALGADIAATEGRYV